MGTIPTVAEPRESCPDQTYSIEARKDYPRHLMFGPLAVGRYAATTAKTVSNFFFHVFGVGLTSFWTQTKP